jgi:hypothetical protein
MKDFDCNLNRMVAQPLEAHAQAPASGLALGCVDWFLYDPAALAASDRATDAVEVRQHETIAIAREQRRLMGYVR